MKSKFAPQHKRMAAGDKRLSYASGGTVRGGRDEPEHQKVAMGDTPGNYAKGGRINIAVRAPTGAPPTPVPDSESARPIGPVERAKRNNGVRGMKKGGKC